MTDRQETHPRWIDVLGFAASVFVLAIAIIEGIPRLIQVGLAVVSLTWSLRQLLSGRDAEERAKK